jgi:hypothetical protein
MDVAHGQHHHLQHVVGYRAERVEGAEGRTRLLVAFTLLVLVGSTVIVGYGNYVGRPSH